MASLKDNGWHTGTDSLRRSYVFPTFGKAVDFINRVATIAEKKDHHPELLNVYNRVEIRLTTHESNGVTERDVGLAQDIEAVAGDGR